MLTLQLSYSRGQTSIFVFLTYHPVLQIDAIFSSLLFAVLTFFFHLFSHELYQFIFYVRLYFDIV